MVGDHMGIHGAVGSFCLRGLFLLRIFLFFDPVPQIAKESTNFSILSRKPLKNLTIFRSFGPGEHFSQFLQKFASGAVWAGR